MVKLNCWEHKCCGREPGGRKADELGICPATTRNDFDGIHDGDNAGRACWVVAGSLCGGRVQGTYALHLGNCRNCDFMVLVKKEEEVSLLGFSHTRLGMERAREKCRKK
jgi:hypothetical protein